MCGGGLGEAGWEEENDSEQAHEDTHGKRMRVGAALHTVSIDDGCGWSIRRLESQYGIDAESAGDVGEPGAGI